MALKFYEFHYAEGQSSELQNIGILFYQTDKPLKREHLTTYTRKFLKNPDAAITISHIAKLDKEEYEKMASKKTT